MKNKEEKTYIAWKSTPNGTPIEGSDRKFRSISKRRILKQLSYEEGLDYHNDRMSILCKDGNYWHVL